MRRASFDPAGMPRSLDLLLGLGGPITEPGELGRDPLLGDHRDEDSAQLAQALVLLGERPLLHRSRSVGEVDGPRVPLLLLPMAIQRLRIVKTTRGAHVMISSAIADSSFSDVGIASSVVGPQTLPFGADDPRLAQHLEVMGDGGLGEVEQRHQLAHADLAGVLSQHIDELQANQGRRAPGDLTAAMPG